MSFPAGNPNLGPSMVVAEAWEDLRRDGFQVRTGATAPAFTTGFAGEATLGKISFAKSGTENIYFSIQFPHNTKVGSKCYPHVHWCPVTANVGAVKFTMTYVKASAINTGTFGTVYTYDMQQTINADSTWKHLIADHATDLGIVTEGMSEVWNCMITRDNAVASNIDDPVAFLYFDIHYQIDAFGSSQEYVK